MDETATAGGCSNFLKLERSRRGKKKLAVTKIFLSILVTGLAANYSDVEPFFVQVETEIKIYRVDYYKSVETIQPTFNQ